MGINQALLDAEKGLFDVLIVWIDSRLGRNTDETRKIRKDLHAFRVQIYSIKRPLTIVDPRYYNPKADRFKHIYEGFNDLMSESESYEFAQKMEFGKKKKAMDGKIPGRIGYGYRKVKRIIEVDGKQKVITDVVSNQKELAVVEQMRDMYENKSYGFRKILEELNSQGSRGPRGGLWNYSTVRYVLKNPLYAGMVRWGWRLSQFRRSKLRLQQGHTGIIKKGEHEAVMSFEDYFKIQKKIELRAKLGGRAVGSRGILVGRLKCGRCGGNCYITSSPSAYAYQMQREGKHKEDFARVRYYVCSSVSKYGLKACKRYVGSQDKIEGAVIEEIRKLANSPEAQKSFEARLKKDTSKELQVRLASLQKELEELPVRRNRFNDAYGKGVMTLSDYGKNISSLNELGIKLGQDISETEEQLEKSQITESKMEKALEAFKNFDQIWNKADFESKKDLILNLIKSVTVLGNKIDIQFNLD